MASVLSYRRGPLFRIRGSAYIHGGSDWLYGAAGSNVITGGSGHEIIHGGGGGNILSAGTDSGDSNIFGGPAGSTNSIDGGPGNDIVFNGPGEPPDGDWSLVKGEGSLDNREIESYGGASMEADSPDGYWIYDPSDPLAPTSIDIPFGFSGNSGDRLSGDTLQYAVFVRWEPNADYTDKLWFTVHSFDPDGNPISNTIVVDETQEPPHDNSSYEPNDVSWLRLGHAQNGGTDDPTLWPTFIGTAAGGITVDVTTYDPNNPTDTVDGKAYIGAIMVRPLWPTVSIHAEAPVPSEAAANADEYRDWLGSSQPTDLPMEAPGVKRVAFDLHGSIETIYHNPDDWDALLQNTPGLEFWTAQTGGTRLQPDVNGNLFDDQFPSSGVYNRTVWVSVDPSADATLGTTEINFTVDPTGDSKTVSAPVKAAALPMGGKDITADLKTGLARLASKFYSLPDYKQLEIMDDITDIPGAFSAWDMPSLKFKSEEFGICTAAGGISPPGVLPEHTVTVNGEVYGVDAVNYIIFGAIMRLCYDRYPALYWLIPHSPLGQSEYGLTAMCATINTYRPLSNLGDGSGVETARRFAEVGWTGDWSYITGKGDPRFAFNPVQYKGFLEWRISPPGLIGRTVEDNIGVIDFLQGPTYDDSNDLTHK